LDPAKPVLLSLGGSLGAQSLNEAIAGKLQMLQEAGIQLIWQCGKFYFEDLKARIPEASGLILTAFIDEMNTVYSAADLVISRAGGSTISELIDLNLPAILVPSPNVAEDHQTKNARSLSDRQAAVLVLDSHASEQLIPEAIAVLNDPERLANIKEGIQKIEKHNAAEEIVDEIFSLITHKNLPDGRKTG
jgi:UDP-N-acetylglucosamine--N-acetylmuramyl-(pentapeptide) pyrophosphoryl-undecaprenol N-acetylglucosamine transferase